MIRLDLDSAGPRRARRPRRSPRVGAPGGRRSPLAAVSLAALAAAGAAAPLAIPPLTFDAAAGGEAVLTLAASVPGTRWSDARDPGGVARVMLGGRVAADVLFHQGDRPFEYRVMLGPVAAGAHELSLVAHPEQPAPALELTGYSVEVVPPDDPRYGPLAAAPFVLSRDRRAFNDALLASFYDPSPHGHLYTTIFSHEDGGTPGPKLLSRWGRRVDIEWTYDGGPESGHYQASRHRRKPFDGARLGGHPLLEVATKNNNFAPLGAWPRPGTRRYLLAPPPLRRPEPLRSRERVLDANPWITRVSQAELEREGMEDPADPDTPAVSDLQGYLYVDTLLDHARFNVRRVREPQVIKGAHLVFEATLADGRRARSDHGERPKSYGLYRHGPARTTIELPPGTRPGDLVALTAQWRGRGLLAAPTLLEVRAFMLDGGFVPGPALFRFNGREPGANGKDLAIPAARGPAS